MTAKKTALRRLRLSPALIIVALIFLSNPYFHNLDLLPDAVGYLLLLCCFGRLGASDESFATANRGFARLAWLSVARMIGLVWSQTTVPIGERPTLVLCLVFVLGVLELMVVIPSCTQLIYGLSYRAMRQGGERVLAGNLTARACFFCQFFAVVKTVLCVLPEISGLADASYRQGVISFNWYAYVNGFRLIAIFLCGVVGLVWLIKTARYVRYVAKDAAFFESMADFCEEDALAHPERRPARRIRLAQRAMLIAVLFVANLYIEGVNYLPSIVTPIALLVALAILWPNLPRALAWAALGVHSLHLIGTSYVSIRTAAFLGEHTEYEIRREFLVREAYEAQVMRPAIWEALLLFASLAMAGVIVWTLVRRYARRSDTATHLHSAGELYRRRMRELGCSLILPAILGLLSCVTQGLYFVIWANPTLVDRVGGLVNMYVVFERFWVVDLLVSLAFALLAWVRLGPVWEMLDRDSMVVERDHRV